MKPWSCVCVREHSEQHCSAGFSVFFCVRCQKPTAEHIIFLCCLMMGSCFHFCLPRKTKTECLFKPNDLVLIYDGRSPGNFEIMTKALGKTLKGLDGLPKRLWTVCRRFFSNAEFTSGGYAAPKRCQSLSPQLPDPLENMILICSKDYRMDFKESPCSDIVCNNRSRGWGGLCMKSRECFECGLVTVEKYKEMAGAPRGEAAADDLAAFLEEEEAEEPLPAVETKKNVNPAPWENSETDYDLALTLYQTSGLGPRQRTRVVGFEAGGGSLAMCCVRRKQACTLFVNNEVHKRVVWQTCLLQIACEVIQQKNNGFTMKKGRVLTREGSLTGQEPARSEVNVASEAPTPSAPASVAADAQDQDTPDDSSSDSS